MSEAEGVKPSDPPPQGDPDAPLPDNAPPFIRAFYDFVLSMEGKPPEEKVDAVIQWVKDHYPRLHPHPEPQEG